MSKTGELDNLFIRLVVLAAVLIGVVYFLLDKKFGTPPELEDAKAYTIFMQPAERGMDRASLAPAAMDTIETNEFKYREG